MRFPMGVRSASMYHANKSSLKGRWRLEVEGHVVNSFFGSDVRKRK